MLASEKSINSSLKVANNKVETFQRNCRSYDLFQCSLSLPFDLDGLDGESDEGVESIAQLVEL